MASFQFALGVKAAVKKQLSSYPGIKAIEVVLRDKGPVLRVTCSKAGFQAVKKKLGQKIMGLSVEVVEISL